LVNAGSRVSLRDLHEVPVPPPPCRSHRQHRLGAAFDWPQWRGPNRDDVSKETGLLKQWPADGPEESLELHQRRTGLRRFSIAAGKLFTMGTRDGGEVLICLDANTGKELWVAKLGKILTNGWGDGPRGTPTIDGD
jgi:hypothetical protein